MEFEQRHRKILEETGISLQGKQKLRHYIVKQIKTSCFRCSDVGYMGYILVYAMALFNVSEEKVTEWNLVARDRAIIKMVKTIINKLSMH